VRPPGQYTEKCHHQHHDQYRSEHRILLFAEAMVLRLTAQPFIALQYIDF
jgi:hypothetical protein